jgi:Flp pilus assembly protein TadG
MNRTRRQSRQRRGVIAVLAAFMLIVLFGFVAFSVDLGYLYNARSEVQRCSDASAIAGCWELVDRDSVSGTSNTDDLKSAARSKVTEYVGYNKILTSTASLAYEDITVGYIEDPKDPTSPFLTSGYTQSPNAVNVKIRFDGTQNSKIPLFFAPVLGVNNSTIQAEATAALLGNFSGFQTPGNGSNCNLLPFALDESTWNGLMSGTGTDSYSYNDTTGSVTTGSDGIKEVNLFPQGTGSPGNRGTVDIGSNNNSTADLARQIVYGISPADFAHHGGSLQLNSSGVLYLNGDTGISAGVKDELASIISETRIIPIFRSVSGPGNNATYTIVKFVGIRMMYVKLTGSMSSKKVMVQPAPVIAKGGITGSNPSSQFVWSPVWLVR